MNFQQWELFSGSPRMITVFFGQYKNMNPRPQYKTSQAWFCTEGLELITAGSALGKGYHRLIQVVPDFSYNWIQVGVKFFTLTG